MVLGTNRYEVLEVHLNLRIAKAAGARAVPARRIVGRAVWIELFAGAFGLRSRCEPGTARAPLAVMRCIQVSVTKIFNLPPNGEPGSLRIHP